MELIIKLSKDSRESDISGVIKYLKAQKCVRKFDMVLDDITTIKKYFR